MTHPSVTPRTYLIVYVALLGLTGTTLATATLLQLGALEVPLALSIAVTKTVLVGLFFMHLGHSSRLVWLVIALGVLFLAVMWTFTWADYYTRGWMPWDGPPVVHPERQSGNRVPGACSCCAASACPHRHHPGAVG